MNQRLRLATIGELLLVLLIAAWLVVDPLWVDPKSYRAFRAPKEWLGVVMACPVVGLWLILELERRRSGIKRKVDKVGTWVLLTAGAFLVWNGLSIFYGKQLSLGAEAFLHLGARTVAALILMRTLTRTRSLGFLLSAILLSATVSAGYSIIQYYGLDPFFEPVKSYYTGRWLASGFIGQPTLFGAYLGMVIPVAVALFIRSSGMVARAGFLLVTIIMLVALLATHTRAVLLGLVFASAPFIILLRRAQVLIGRRKPILVTISAATLLVIVPFIIANPSLTERFGLMSRFKTDSVGARLFYWRVIAEMVRDRPVQGFGLGTFKYYYYDYQCQVLDQGTSLRAYTRQLVFHAHNEYLQALVETGIIGFGLLVGLMVTVLKGGLARINACQRDETRVLLIGLLAGLVVALFDAVFSFPFHIASTGLLTAVYCGVLLSPLEQSGRTDED